MDKFILHILHILILVPGISVLPLSSLDELSNEIGKGGKTTPGENGTSHLGFENLTINAFDEVNSDKVVIWNRFLHFINKFDKNSGHDESVSLFETSASHGPETHRTKRSSGWPDRDKCCQTWVSFRTISQGHAFCSVPSS